jgi:hypothetical protein
VTAGTEPVLETFGPDPTHGRTMLFAELGRLEDWPAGIRDPHPHFVLFVAADARGVRDEPIAEFADRVISQGAVYLCAWGPDCERVHDVFDDVLLQKSIDGEASFSRERIVMTTWHDEEPLDEALYYALFESIPAMDYFDSCHAVLSICVGQPEWADEVRRLLAEPSHLIADVLSREDEVNPSRLEAFVNRVVSAARLRRS